MNADSNKRHEGSDKTYIILNVLGIANKACK